MRHAQILAQAIRDATGLTLAPDTVDTNMVIFEVDPALGTAGQFAATLKAHGVWMLAIGATLVRAVTHLDVSRDEASQPPRSFRAWRRVWPRERSRRATMNRRIDCTRADVHGPSA